MADSSDNGREAAGETLQLQKVYANLYNEIIEPDRVVVMTQYFRRAWVPRLGHSLAWLIIALRQRCYWNRKTGELRNSCQVTQEDLAAEIGVEPRTVRRLLEHPLAERFIIEVKGRYNYDQRLGKRVRETTTYQIRMDDPLTPEDEALLRQRLEDTAGGQTSDPTTGQQDVLQLLDRLIGAVNVPSGNGHLPDKMSTRSDLPDKMSTRSSHLPDKMSTRSDHLVDILSGDPRHLPDKMSGINNNSTLINTLLLTVPQQHQQHVPPTPTPSVVGVVADAVVTTNALTNLTLAPEAVLVPLEPDLPSGENDTEPETYRIETIAAVVQRDLLRAQHAGSITVLSRTEVYYSVAHALGEGEEAWQPDELARIELRTRLERELGANLARWGAFSLAAALQSYFSPDLVPRFLADKSEAELRRIASWLAYTRSATSLKSPSGFLRSKIESREEPPVAVA